MSRLSWLTFKYCDILNIIIYSKLGHIVLIVFLAGFGCFYLFLVHETNETNSLLLVQCPRFDWILNKSESLVLIYIVKECLLTYKCLGGLLFRCLCSVSLLKSYIYSTFPSLFSYNRHNWDLVYLNVFSFSAYILGRYFMLYDWVSWPWCQNKAWIYVNWK